MDTVSLLDGDNRKSCHVYYLKYQKKSKILCWRYTFTVSMFIADKLIVTFRFLMCQGFIVEKVH